LEVLHFGGGQPPFGTHDQADRIGTGEKIPVEAPLVQGDLVEEEEGTFSLPVGDQVPGRNRRPDFANPGIPRLLGGFPGDGGPPVGLVAAVFPVRPGHAMVADHGDNGRDPGLTGLTDHIVELSCLQEEREQDNPGTQGNFGFRGFDDPEREVVGGDFGDLEDEAGRSVEGGDPLPDGDSPDPDQVVVLPAPELDQRAVPGSGGQDQLLHGMTRVSPRRSRTASWRTMS
jgi:hypothetical protein